MYAKCARARVQPPLAYDVRILPYSETTQWHANRHSGWAIELALPAHPTTLIPPLPLVYQGRPPFLPGLPLGGKVCGFLGPTLGQPVMLADPASREKKNKTDYATTQLKFKMTQQKKVVKKRTRLCSRGRLTMSDPCHMELSARERGGHAH